MQQLLSSMHHLMHIIGAHDHLCTHLLLTHCLRNALLSVHSPERKEDVTFASNYMVFGHGPHYCVGKEYAINHLITFLAILSTSLDWTRFRCEGNTWLGLLVELHCMQTVQQNHNSVMPQQACRVHWVH